MFDICPNCNGTGERDFLSGARCYYCDGTGMIEDTLEVYDDFEEDDEPHDQETTTGNAATED